MDRRIEAPQALQARLKREAADRARKARSKRKQEREVDRAIVDALVEALATVERAGPRQHERFVSYLRQRATALIDKSDHPDGRAAVLTRMRMRMSPIDRQATAGSQVIDDKSE